MTKKRLSSPFLSFANLSKFVQFGRFWMIPVVRSKADVGAVFNDSSGTYTQINVDASGGVDP